MYRHSPHSSAAAEDLLGPRLRSRADVEKLLAGLTALHHGDESRARRDLRSNLNAEDRRAFDAFAPKRKVGRQPGARARKPNRHLSHELERRFYRELVPGATDRDFAVFALRRNGHVDDGSDGFNTEVESFLRGMRNYRKLP